MHNPVSFHKSGDTAIVVIDNPPVNALSNSVRTGLLAAFAALKRDQAIKGIILRCAGRTFVAGADIVEFAEGKALDPDPNDVHRMIEELGKPVVAAIHGSALGGGLELALACHYRVAAASARLGLPEVTLGLLPGAGGTQRLPRLVGIAHALPMILSGAPVPAGEALEMGLIDRLVDGELLDGATDFLSKIAAKGSPLKKSSECIIPDLPVPAEYFDKARTSLSARDRSNPAKGKIIECLEAATRLPFEQGLAIERNQFVASLQTPESAALRTLFFAEREAARIPGLPKGLSIRRIGTVGVVGAGTMGGGIAMCFANAGFSVHLLEVDNDALGRGLNAIRKTYEISASRGKLSASEVEERMALIVGSVEYENLSNCDLVIEAVFENMAIKENVCKKLGVVCKPGALIATNTSTLNVDVLARASGRPHDFLGLHFFSPANVMRLLEIVRGAETAPDALATALAVAKTIGKVGVVSGVCYGFIGNRMLEGYLREAEFLLMEGASPQQVDNAIESYGMAMGPHRMMDLAGVDVGAKILLEWRAGGGMPTHPAYRAVVRKLYEVGRMGQKTAAGYYRYDGRKAMPDPEVERLCAELAAQHNIKRRVNIDDDEIVKRCLYPLINEGARILAEGIAYRSGDIDVVWTSGYGFPPTKGGPMHQAEIIGFDTVVNDLDVIGALLGNEYEWWTPAPLLRRLAAEGGSWHDAHHGPIK